MRAQKPYKGQLKNVLLFRMHKYVRVHYRMLRFQKQSKRSLVPPVYNYQITEFEFSGVLS